MGTIDEFLWKLIERKLEVLGTTLNGEMEKLEVDHQLSQEAPSSEFVDKFIGYLFDTMQDYEERVSILVYFLPLLVLSGLLTFCL